MAKRTSSHSRKFVFLARVGITLAAVGLFALIRMDVTQAVWTKSSTYIKDSWIRYQSGSVIQTYLKEHTIRRLQIGAGTNSKKDWLNTDIEPLPGQAYLDATETFPLPDRSIQYITSEHVIEHIGYQQGIGMLKESFRVLTPGGRIRVATPNLMKFVALFQEDKSPEMQHYLIGKTTWHDWPTTPDQECYILNQQLREWGHRFVYTPRMLRNSLKAAGFEDIQEFQAGESSDPSLRGLEMRSASNVADLNKYETMVLEGVRKR